MAKPVPWFNVQAAAEGVPAGEVSIRGYIGDWGVNDRDFIASVEALGDVDEINVSINSRGGEVDHALAIFNYLTSHPAKITVRVTGVAMSAASIIAMAGDEIIMPANTLMMVHNPWTYAAGSAEELRKVADDMDAFETALRETYMARTGLNEKEIRELLDETTYMTAAEAVEKGFADRVEPIGKQANAQSAAVAFAAALSIPDEVLAKIESAEQMADDDSPQDDTVTDDDPDTGGTEVEDQLIADDQDVPSAEAPAGNHTRLIIAAAEAAGLSDYATVFALDSSLTSPASIAQAVAEAREIVELSDLAGKPAMAATLIRERASLDKARTDLQNALALDDEQRQTDNHLPNAGHPAPPQRQTTASIWEARNAARKRH